MKPWEVSQHGRLDRRQVDEPSFRFGDDLVRDDDDVTSIQLET
jgi:hypothetical protein